MKRLVLVALLFIATTTLNSQTPVKAVWDYPTAGLVDVTEFQVKVDAAAYVSIGLPTAQTLADTAPDHRSFSYTLPTLQNGVAHNVAVRACNALECSTSIATSFRLIGPPSNLRIAR